MPQASNARALSRPEAKWWQPVLLAALAGGMGWGIRGQYGHETGAMIAGLLVGSTLVFLICPQASSLTAARAVAWCTVAIGFGGSMTYGQTIGLTQDTPLIGNLEALCWGMLGLAIKGGIWIGFAGVFLGMGLGDVRYRARELLVLMLALVALFIVGTRLLNEPFDPANKVLPKIYFSDDWRWEPGANLKPRRELWGGLLFALLGVTAYTGAWRRDRLAGNLAGWGILGGAIGFPLGQSLQAFHAWNPSLFRGGALGSLDPYMNWWNMMETTFGATSGATLGLGLWLNRKHAAANTAAELVALNPGIELWLVVIHATLLVTVEFFTVPVIDDVADIGLVMGVIPIVGVAAGRWWPYMLVLPITLLPIAGKTVRQLCYTEHSLPAVVGWVIYLALPLALTSAACVWLARTSQAQQGGRTFTRRILLLATWLYWGLNFAFFHFPWPWCAWTGRTPNGIIFTACALGLTLAALTIGRSQTAVVKQV
jgi:hypothetical protein